MTIGWRTRACLACVCACVASKRASASFHRSSIVRRHASGSTISQRASAGHVRLGADHLVVKRGRQALDADEHLAGLELLDQPPRRLRRVRDLVGVLAQPRAHVACAGRDRLAHRMQVHVIDLAQRALRLGIEPAQRLDLVAEQLDAHRMRRERRVDVDHAAAHRERAGLVDDRRARPATGDEQRRDLIAIDRVALLDREPARRELGRRERAARRAPRPT